MEVSILETKGFEGDLVLSIRAGAARRQAPISTDQPFSFPCSILNANPFKIDVMKPVAKKSVHICPTKEVYSVPFATPDGKERGVMTFQVKEAPLKCGVKGSPAKPGEANVAGSDWNFPSADKDQTSERKQATAAAARKYLDRFNLLNIVQEMLQHIIREKPEEPLIEMAKHLCRLSGHRTEPEIARTEGQNAENGDLDASRMKVADALLSSLDDGRLNNLLGSAQADEGVEDARKKVAGALLSSLDDGSLAQQLLHSPQATEEPFVLWVRGTAVPAWSAKDFFDALKAEVVDKVELAASRWLEQPSISKHVRAAFSPEVDIIRNARWKNDALAALATRWGFLAAAKAAADISWAEKEAEAAVKIQSIHRGRDCRKAAAERAKGAKDGAKPTDPGPQHGWGKADRCGRDCREAAVAARPPVPASAPEPAKSVPASAPEPAKSVPPSAPEIAKADAMTVDEVPDQVVSLMMRQNERIDGENERLRDEIQKLKQIVDDKGIPPLMALSSDDLLAPVGTLASGSPEDLARREELAGRNVELRKEHEALQVQLSSFCSELSTIAGRLAATVTPNSAATAVYVEEHAAATNARLEAENRALARQIQDLSST